MDLAEDTRERIASILRIAEGKLIQKTEVDAQGKLWLWFAGGGWLCLWGDKVWVKYHD